MARHLYCISSPPVLYLIATCALGGRTAVYLPTARPIYYRDADAALLVFDITDVDSFTRVKNWVKVRERKRSPVWGVGGGGRVKERNQ